MKKVISKIKSKNKYAKHQPKKAKIAEPEVAYLANNGKKIPLDSIICGDALKG
jgi:hypothetical protein